MQVGGNRVAVANPTAFRARGPAVWGGAPALAGGLNDSGGGRIAVGLESLTYAVFAVPQVPAGCY